jgi:hypothetical protein
VEVQILLSQMLSKNWMEGALGHSQLLSLCLVDVLIVVYHREGAPGMGIEALNAVEK